MTGAAAARPAAVRGARHRARPPADGRLARPRDRRHDGAAGLPRRRLVPARRRLHGRRRRARLPSYWLVQARPHRASAATGWSATGWAVMAAWTVALTVLAVAGLPARHREARSARSGDDLGMTMARRRAAGGGARRARRSRIRAGVALGLLFLVGPIVGPRRDEPLDAAARRHRARPVALFVAIYLSLLPPARWLARRGAARRLGALALLPAIASRAARRRRARLVLGAVRLRRRRGRDAAAAARRGAR